MDNIISLRTEPSLPDFPAFEAAVHARVPHARALPTEARVGVERIGRLVHVLRLKNGWTWRELETRTGLPWLQLALLEQGLLLPSELTDEALEKLGHAFPARPGVPHPDVLFHAMAERLQQLSLPAANAVVEASSTEGSAPTGPGEIPTALGRANEVVSPLPSGRTLSDRAPTLSPGPPRSILDSVRTLIGAPHKPRHDYVDSTLFFPELDVERMKRRMNLEGEGERCGAGNQPATNSPVLDAVEQRIITTIESEKRLALEKCVDHLKTYADRLAALGFQSKFTQGYAAADSALGDFKAQGRVGANRLFQCRRAIVRIDDEMERFRHEHGLQRLARYPQLRTWHWVGILALFVVEGILNGPFIAVGDPFGLVGGTTKALAIAVLNVGVGLVVGRKVVPRLVHRKPLWKLLGCLGVGLYGGWMLGFNLAVAHYRYALGGEQPEQATHLALASLLAQPLGIADMEAWFLFALGCGFSLLAAGDGWSMDDPYPGYGDLARHQAERIEEYAAQTQVLMAELEELRNTALEKMEAAADGIEKRQAEYRAIVGSSARLTRDFWQYLTYLEQCGNELLATYREANRRARSTPPPRHFDQPWVMPRPSELELGQAGAIDNPTLDAEIGRVFAQLQEKRQQVHAAYEAAMSEYKSIDELTPEAIRDDRFQPSQA